MFCLIFHHREEAISSHTTLEARAAALLAVKEARIREENERFLLSTQVGAPLHGEGNLVDGTPYRHAT